MVNNNHIFGDLWFLFVVVVEIQLIYNINFRCTTLLNIFMDYIPFKVIRKQWLYAVQLETSGFFLIKLGRGGYCWTGPDCWVFMPVHCGTMGINCLLSVNIICLTNFSKNYVFLHT